MKLPPFVDVLAFTTIQECSNKLRREVIDSVDRLLETYQSVRELEGMCNVLDGIRDNLASMALKRKREEQRKPAPQLLLKGDFQNTAFTFTGLLTGTQTKEETNGKRKQDRKRLR